ncbi:hypothetical protein OAK19_03070 [Aureispira]|nr:hypothetical protein [Aureispira sp.]
MSFPNAANYNFTVVNEANLNSLVTNAAAVAGDLSVSGNLTVAGSISPGTFTNRVASLTANAAEALTAAQSGTTFVLNRAAGIAITLPTAAVGLNFEFVVGTSSGGGPYTITGATTSENFQGSFAVLVGSTTDYANATIQTWTVPLAAGTDNSMSLQATTSGGLAGGCIKFNCIRDATAGVSLVNWQVSGYGYKPAAGAAATPFA